MIKPEQMTAYDDASKEIEKAITILDNVNVARFNGEHSQRLWELSKDLKSLRHELFKEAHDAFLRARGLK